MCTQKHKAQQKAKKHKAKTRANIQEIKMQQNQNMQQAKNTRGQKHMKIKIPYKKAIFYKNPPCILQGDLFSTQKMP